MRNQTLTVSSVPGQNVFVRVYSFLASKDRVMSAIFSADLCKGFGIGMSLAILFVFSAIVIENEVEFNGWCVALWILAVMLAIPSLIHYCQNSKS